jgi:excinuclease ABC subunit C
MKYAQTNDDYAMMAEMLTRRFTGADAVLPDVALIDGGKGQLSAATKALADLGVTSVLLIGIAKGPDRNAGLEDYYINGQEPFKLEHGSELAFFVQRLRDEAHRYAISSHRAKRDREIKKSQLDEIAGVGAVRKKALLGHFGSVGAIKLASVDELTKAHGINRQVAQIIYNYFH